MTNDTLFKYQSEYEFKQQNWFKITISDAGVGDSDATDPSENVTFYVQTCSLPEISFSPTEAHVGNRIYKSAGKPEYNEHSLTFTDDLSDEVATFFYRWQLQIFNPDEGRMGRKTDYQRTIFVEEMAPEGDTIVKWKFRGCWPSNVSYGELDYSGSDRREVSVTLTYDFASVVEAANSKRLTPFKNPSSGKGKGTIQ